MYKHLLYFFIFFNAFVSFSQNAASSTRTLRVASAATVFNQNIPIGTLVLNIDENKLFIARAGIEYSETLTTATADFELLNDVINDSYSIILDPQENEDNYDTTTTKGGTLLVDPLDGATVTITLNTAEVAVGKRYSVKKANETTGTVKVVSDSGTIDGAEGIETNVPYQGWVLQFDGTDWHIIGHI